MESAWRSWLVALLDVALDSLLCHHSPCAVLQQMVSLLFRLYLLPILHECDWHTWRFDAFYLQFLDTVLHVFFFSSLSRLHVVLVHGRTSIRHRSVGVISLDVNVWSTSWLAGALGLWVDIDGVLWLSKRRWLDGLGN